MRCTAPSGARSSKAGRAGRASFWEHTTALKAHRGSVLRPFVKRLEMMLFWTRMPIAVIRLRANDLRPFRKRALSRTQMGYATGRAPECKLSVFHKKDAQLRLVSNRNIMHDIFFHVRATICRSVPHAATVRCDVDLGGVVGIGNDAVAPFEVVPSDLRPM